MRILIYGAGVIGSVYAARLHQGGQSVSVLARGQRLATLRERGIVVEEAATGERAEVQVRVVDRLEPEDAYDLVVVAMQKSQLPAVLPVLGANRNTPSVLFLGNNAAGPDALVEALGEGRVLMGFPSVGGYFDGPLVRFAGQGARLGVTLGELDGGTSPRLERFVEAFTSAGVDVSVEPHVDAWLKAHVALVLPIVFGLERHGLDNQELARDRETLRRMARAVREGLGALRALGYPIRPFRLAAITWLPIAVTSAILGKILASDFAKVAFAGHAAVARAEFDMLLEELRQLIAMSGRAAPSLDALCAPSPATS